jgi:hypothetical protein
MTYIICVQKMEQTAESVGKYKYNDEALQNYITFVKLCTCYNTINSTDILMNKRCKIFGAKKIRAFVKEFMDERRLIESRDAVSTEAVSIDAAGTDAVSIDAAGTERANTNAAGTNAVSRDASNTEDTPVQTIFNATDRSRTFMLLAIIERLSSFARIGGGMMICALADYMTLKEWESYLFRIEILQSEELLWTEPFIRICINSPSAVSLDKYIEEEAEKIPARLSFMRYDEHVEIMFID